MRRLMAILAVIVALATARGRVPEGYYDTLEGRSGDQLVISLRALAMGHRVVSYGQATWDAFVTTDVIRVGDRQAWRDMYSNNLVFQPGHAALNIEHSVANSWWGGKDGSIEAYSDLFHLNPSDQNANNRKSNLPPGEVGDTRLLDNGVLRIGTPLPGLGGGAANVFEPADEYKGDFARAYFYIFTTYGDLTWRDDLAYVHDGEGNLSPWVAAMLLRWHRADPVDSREIARNEAIYTIQGNRNPFIDYPEIADHIWGESTSEALNLQGKSAAEPADRPAAPRFPGARMTGLNTYTARWSETAEIMVSHEDGQLWVSRDDGEFTSSSSFGLTPPSNQRDTHTFTAFTRLESDGQILDSPTARLTMTAYIPGSDDISCARWQQVTREQRLTFGEEPYIILDSSTLHVMAIPGTDDSGAFMPSGGFAGHDSDLIIDLPVQAAIITLQAVGDKQRLLVSDIYRNPVGYWNATAKNKMRLDPVTYTPGSAAINADDTFSFTFDSHGSLQYNAGQPRFLNYESRQTPVLLYRYLDGQGGWTDGITDIADDWSIGIDHDTLITPPGTLIFDMSGRRVSGTNLSHGIYIVVSPRGTRKIAL